MFIDEAIIKVEAGDGGNGCWAYERTRSRPKGRPTGGTGGRGGHVYVRGSSQLHTLQDVSYRKHYRAERGTHGKGSNLTGRGGADITIDVPLGTIVRDRHTGRVICDCIDEGKRYRIARGGRGGKGTTELATRANPHPQFVQPGGKGERRTLALSLKVLADVGLVGRPNAGKSTFLSRVSHARPAVAEYPFTTTRPHLGIVTFPESYQSMVMADIPGLIENSHTGKGLGVRFLRHIERTRILAVLVECTSADPQGDAQVLMRELRAYSPALAEKPICFVLTKADLCEDNPHIPTGWLAMSAVTGKGVAQVLGRLRDMHAALPPDEKTDITGADE